MLIAGLVGVTAGLYLTFHAFMARKSLEHETKSAFQSRMDPTKVQGLRRTRRREARTAIEHRRAYMIFGSLLLAAGIVMLFSAAAA